METSSQDTNAETNRSVTAFAHPRSCPRCGELIKRDEWGFFIEEAAWVPVDGEIHASCLLEEEEVG